VLKPTSTAALRDRLDNRPAVHLKRSARSACSRTGDPVTGETSYVFSCFNQDQPLDSVDFKGCTSAEAELARRKAERGLAAPTACRTEELRTFI